MGRQRLHTDVRRLPAPRRPGGRSARAQARLPRRPRRLHAGVLAERARRLVDDAHPRAQPAGLRGRADLPAALSIITTTFAEGPERNKAMGVWAAIATGGAPRPDCSQAASSSSFSRGRGSSSSTSRSGSPRVWRRFASRVPRRRAQDLRHPGRGDRDGGPDRARLRNRLDGAGGWSPQTLGFLGLAVVLLSAFIVIERRSPEPLVRLSIFGVDPYPARRERGHARRRLGPLRDVLLQHAVHPAGARLLAAPGRARVPALHGRHRDQGRGSRSR